MNTNQNGELTALSQLIYFYIFNFFGQAAEQAKASPALVAKDPGAVANKKEEEDLAKGEFVYLLTQIICWSVSSEAGTLLPSSLCAVHLWIVDMISIPSFLEGQRSKLILCIKQN